MFGNKFYSWKLGTALAGIAVLGVISARRGESINPALWRCVVQPQRWDNTALWIPFGRIVTTGDSDFEVAAGDAQIRVLGRSPAPAGSFVTLRGVFRAEGPRLELLTARVIPADHQRRRLLMELVSLAVLAAVIANFVRHFSVRPQVLQIHSGDER